MRIIDVHTHGFGDYSSKGASPGDILEIARLHGSTGVDAVIPTIYPSSIEQMRLDIAAVKKAIGEQRKKRGSREGSASATILGAHLEGPFLNPALAGALDRGSFLAATADNFRRLIEGFDGIVRIITIAPELEGAAKLIKLITDAGIIVNMGHSDATFVEAEEGFRAGARGITHIFNAMRGFHHREPGIAGFGLMNTDVYIEVIADPYHLHRKTLELIFRMKDPERIVLVSDLVKGSVNDVSGDAAADKSGRLRGGSLALTGSIRHLIGLGFDPGIVERAASENPARYLGIIDP